MLTATLAAPRRFELSEREPPVAGPGEIVLRVDGCGVCGSNLPPWTGTAGVAYPLPPGEPGHEAWGTVAALGEGVEDLAVGQAVAALTYRSFAELDVASAENVVALPAALAGRPLPGEPLACAVNVARRSGVAAGDLVVVVGSGFLGSLVVQLLAADEAARPRRIVAVSRRRASLAAAEAAGADERLSYDDDVDGRVGELSAGHGADVVVEATGAQAPLDLAARLVRVRGRLVVAGFHQDGPRTVDMQSWNWRGIDVVNAHERDPRIYLDGMRRAVELVAAGRLDPEPLFTHRFPLADIECAFAVAEARPEDFVKALVTCR